MAPPRILVLATLMIASSAIAVGAPKTTERQAFWDAVYATAAVGRPDCTLSSKAPARCRKSDHLSEECASYLEWSAGGKLECPGLCGNPSLVTIENNVLKFDLEYVSRDTNVDRRAGDPPLHNADLPRQKRAFAIPLSKGTASQGKYDNTKKNVDLDLTIAVSPPIKGAERDGRKMTELVFDKVKVTGNFGQSAGRCDTLSYNASSGRGGTIEVTLIARDHDDAKASCTLLLYAPDYKEGRDCGRHDRECVGKGQTCGDCCGSLYCNTDNICVSPF